MARSVCVSKETVLVAIGGAVIGGVAVALATRAIPKIMSRAMAGMMHNMMAQMAKGGCSPAEI
jgi:CheY-specific phosphatase CheX